MALLLARAFRLYCTNASGTYYRIGEIEVRATPEGPDLCVGGTAFGNSDYYPASRAFDNSNISDNDAWVGNPGASCTVGYNWGTPTEIGQITIYNGVGPGAGQNGFDFDFQYTVDGSNWFTLFSVPRTERATTGGAAYTYQLSISSISGTVHDESGSPAVGRTVRVYRRMDGALLGEVVTNGSGWYTLGIAGTPGEMQRIVLDNDAGSLCNDLIDRVMLS